MGNMEAPLHGCSKLLQVPSAVLYRLEAGGHLGVPRKGHSSASISARSVANLFLDCLPFALGYL